MLNSRLPQRGVIVTAMYEDAIPATYTQLNAVFTQ